ncbi:MAG: saccharopine dehydrogenase [Pseudomonadales bacterium]|nr:saccharopine dehydrogenase [Pseudomonadales bacterium]
MTQSREFDVVIWGATGFTGGYVVDYMANAYSGSNLKWAIAGRNLEKLEALVGEKSIDGINVFQADAMDLDSMRELVQKTRVVLTTVGPYARYGSELVAACAEHGTHYCDLTGETHWMREMIEAHQQTAERSGAIIVPTCGFDSIPSDLGTYFLQREMVAKTGQASQHIKYRTRSFKGGFSGGTLDSMMAMMEKAETHPELLDAVADPYVLNFKERGLDGPDSNHAHYDADFDGWVAPFVMAAINTRVVRRSNELLGFMYGHDFRYDEGMFMGQGPKGAISANAAGMGIAAMNRLPRFRPVRELMQRFLPKPGEGPTPEQVENGHFEIELMAKGPTPADDLRVDVKGQQDPGYGATAKMLAESAVCLAQDELDVGGGFWTPASAMGDQLLKRLPDNAQVTFELHA